MVTPACVLSAPDLLRVREYAAKVVDATRHPAAYGLDLAETVAWGASPRATISLVLGAKARALLTGRDYIVPHDVKAVAHAALRHRILLTYVAEAAGTGTDAVVDTVLEAVEVP